MSYTLLDLGFRWGAWREPGSDSYL